PGSMGAPALYEGFEGASFPPKGWSVTNNTFARSGVNSITGSYSARYNNTGQGSPQSGKKLRTTKVVVDATSPDLSFKARAGSRAEDEQLKVGYSTSPTGPYTYFPTNATLSNRVQTFTYTINDLTPDEYYFVFETYCSVARNKNRSWIIDEVAGPLLWINPLPTPALNIRSWAAGSFAPGDAAYSGDIFQISNTTGGELTIISVTDLSDTEFETTLNLDISLVAGQIHEFGFSYEPLDYGTDNQAFVITTNGGDITINLSGSSLSSVFSDSFENYADFATSFSPWTTFNGDEGTPGGVDGIVFPNSTTFTDWIIFNPANTNPPMGNAAPHSGEKYAMAIYNNEETLNDDWMITPALTLEGSPTISFWARSYGAGYPETFKVYYSTTNNTAPDSFTRLVTKTNVPTAWTKYTYSLPEACANQPVVYLAIVHASENKFMLFIDDVLVTDDSPLVTPQFGNINGYVYRSGTTTPVEGALVTAGTKITYSDANGFYQLNNILAGSHSITVNADAQLYFPAVEDDVVVTDGNITNQNLYLTWAEIMVNPESITSNLLLGETEDISLTISNPGGTADLNYELYLTTSTRGNNRINNQFSKKPSLGADVKRITDLTFHHQSDRDEGWMGYTDFDDATSYYNATTNNREKAVKFSIDDFGIWANGVTISKLRALFYNPGGSEEWGSSANFYFKIYDASGTGEALYTSRTYTANSLVDMVDVLPTPLVITTDFWVSVYCTNSFGKPHLVGSSYNNGHSYMGPNSDAWSPVAGFDWFLDAYTTGDEWIRASSYSGTVAPGASVNTNIHLDTNNLSVGTQNAYMYIFNNSNHNANRNNHMMIPITLNVTDSAAITTPENLVIAKSTGIISISWDNVNGANSYNVYGCNTPDGEFTPLGSVADPYIELTDAELEAAGLDSRAFFYVKADSAPHNPSKVITQRKLANPLGSPKSKGWNRK
ncbi:MAG: choice-of-anchor J domain-containing protein, partial [Candidatus Cloacimonadales bacterium]